MESYATISFTWFQHSPHSPLPGCGLTNKLLYFLTCHTLFSTYTHTLTIKLVWQLSPLQLAPTPATFPYKLDRNVSMSTKNLHRKTFSKLLFTSVPQLPQVPPLGCLLFHSHLHPCLSPGSHHHFSHKTEIYDPTPSGWRRPAPEKLLS